jgi:hypothetical protein
VQRKELGSETGAEVVPIYEMGVADISGSGFPVVDAVGPFLGSALVHVGHGPLNLRLLVRELIRPQAEVRLARVYEAFSLLPIAVEIWWWRWF